jgi:hypothetical protein
MATTAGPYVFSLFDAQDLLRNQHFKFGYEKETTAVALTGFVLVHL